MQPCCVLFESILHLPNCYSYGRSPCFFRGTEFRQMNNFLAREIRDTNRDPNVDVLNHCAAVRIKRAGYLILARQIISNCNTPHPFRSIRRLLDERSKMFTRSSLTKRNPRERVIVTSAKRSREYLLSRQHWNPPLELLDSPFHYKFIRRAKKQHSTSLAFYLSE